MDERRILLVIFDGLGDRPLTELGHKTPLESTPRPNLDWFAANGVNGLVDPIAPGIVAGSDTSHLALFGYDPHEVYTGRGPFEAAGVGIDLQKGDIAFRGNFASVDEDMRLTDRRAGRFREGTDELAKALNSFTKQAYKILKSHTVNRSRIAKGEPPANMIVLRGAGIYPDLVPITERLHLKAAGIAGVALIRGMFRTVGIEPIDVPGATGGLDTDMIAKADAALEALKTYDLVVLHVKATDLCGHDGKASEKIRVIERMDTMMGHLKSKLSSDVVVAITADHSTPVSVKEHSGDPVPLTIFGEGVRVDSVLNFDERSVAAGALGRIRGQDVMNLLL